MIYGYARCSTNETKQDIDRQARELIAAGAATVIKEYIHGDTAAKAEQDKLFSTLRSGDTLMVTEVSRLSRSTKQLCEIIDKVKEKQIKLVILNSITIDCTRGELDPMTKAFLQIAGVFGELELSMIRERVRSGMANARAKGSRIGRKPTSKDDIPPLFYKHYPSYISGKINVSEFARLCDLSRPSVYKYLKLME